MMMMIASEMICEMYESAMFIYNYIANYYNKKKDTKFHVRISKQKNKYLMPNSSV